MAPIETERLILREFTLEDAAAFQVLNADPEVLRYTYDAPLQSLEAARRALEEAPLRDYATYGYGRVACVLKDSDELIGFSGLKYLPEYGETDIGYRFMRRFWGQGLATESARPMMRYGREALGLERIVGLVDPDNDASVNVLRKLGLSYERAEFVPEIGREMHVYA
jgi:RimJ/RimL family protein N-acetyltransferase